MVKIFKLNRKWTLILLGSLSAISITIVTLIFMDEVTKPEEKVTVYEFRKSMEANSELLPEHLKSVWIPKSQVKSNYVTDLSYIDQSVLAEPVRKDEYLVIQMINKRGESTVDIDLDSYWKVSIDIKNQENFIGHQLIRGQSYQLFYRELESNDNIRKKGWISEVIIIDLIDQLGNKVFQIKDENIHSVVLAIKDIESLEFIVEEKSDIEFELVKAPKEFIADQYFDKENLDEKISAKEI